MDESKITTEELYGKSDPPADEPTKPLVYEETPIIEPPIQSGPVPRKPKNLGSFLTTIGTIVLFVILFGVGVWLSTVIRQYFPTTPTPASPELQRGEPVEIPVSEVTLNPSNPYAAWQIYEVVSGATKVAIPGVSFKLPPEVLVPICDGANCASQGTYLSGGTRFTVAPRGGDQALRDFRGAVVTDAGGREFTTTPATVTGKQALEFKGLFTGTTGGGYSFTQMRGVMIEVDSTLSLEINHFTPTGVSADFASDDRVFDQILQTLILP